MLTDERIDELVRIKCPALFKSNILYLEAFHAIEAEVLQAQEPVAEVVKFGIYRTMAGLFMPVGTKLYAAQQPPAPCPKCDANEKTLQAIAEHVDWAFIGELDDVVASRINERNDAIAHFAAERDALQAKVAELSEELEEWRMTNKIDELYRELDANKIKVAEQRAEIERLTKARDYQERSGAAGWRKCEELQATIAQQAALIEKCDSFIAMVEEEFPVSSKQVLDAIADHKQRSISAQKGGA